MAPIARTGTIVVLLAAVVGAFYTTRLQFSPIYVMHDELQFALQAQTIASTGRDLHGRLLPVYFTEPEFPAGRDPVAIYATALVLKALPLSEGSVRLATAWVGVLNVVLMFLVGRKVFGSSAMGLVAALLLAMTPAHFIRSRLILSPLYSIPFILAWLLWLARYVERPARRTLAVSVAWLSLGLYTYLACVVMVPVYLILTAIAVARQPVSNWRWPVAAALLIPLVPMGIWFATHPERYGQIVEAYRLAGLEGGQGQTPSLGAMTDVIKGRMGLYWSAFDPAFLFVSGDTSLINSTRRIGFLPMAFAVLLPVGVYRLVRQGGILGAVMIAGLLIAPLASVVSGAIEMNRIMFVIPFAALVATAGAQAILVQGQTAWRVIGLILLITVPVQFSSFYADYMGSYRTESSVWFGGNLRDALNDALGRIGAESHPTYLSRDIPHADRYWRFYALAAGRADLVEQFELYDPSTMDMADLDPDSLLVCGTQGDCAPQAQSAMWTRVSVASEPDGTESFAVYERR